MRDTWIFSKKTIYTLIALIVIYGLSGFFLLPVIGKNILKDKLSAFLQRQVTIEKISVNPFSLTAEIHGLRIKKKKIFCSIDRIYVNLNVASLFTLTPVVTDFLVEEPSFFPVRNSDGSFNFSDLLNTEKDTVQKNKQKNRKFQEIPDFILKNLRITRGEIKFKDKKENISHLVKDISVSLPFLSSKKKYRNEKSKLNIKLVLNNTKVNINAGFSPFAENPAADADLTTSNIDLVHYLAYLPIPESIKVISLGINCDVHADFKREKLKNFLFLKGKFNAVNADIEGHDQEKIIKFPALSLDVSKSDILAGRINISDFLIKSLSVFDSKSKEEIINIPEFGIKDATIDLGKKTMSTGDIVVKNGKILLKRLKDGQINLIRAFLPDSSQIGTAIPEHALPSKDAMQLGALGKKDGFSSDNKQVNGTKSAAQVAVQVKSVNKMSDTKSSSDKSAWKVTMNSLNLSGFDLAFKDFTNNDPVDINLSNIFIKADNFKNFGKENGHMAINMDFNDKGKISIKGNLIPSILKADLNLDFKKIDVKSLQPYFTNSIRVLVTDGNIQTKGRLKLNLNDQVRKKIKFDFKGQTSLNNFICLDKQSAKDFFKCNSLYFSGLETSVYPVKIRIKDVSLTDFYSRIIISRKGRLNLNSIFKNNVGKKQTQKKLKVKKTAEISERVDKVNKAKSDSDTKDISIKNVTLQNGDINFTDYSTNPGFTADMKKITGSLTGLSSDEKSRAELHLQGIHGQSSPLEIKGKINPLAKKKFADISLSFKDIELTNFTPYSSKYLGYKIKKGKLALNLKYLINGNKLTSDNKINFDDLTLGDRVKSDKATSLPVSLAISLLKNRKGQIDLDLPVRGELNDPSFKISSIVFKMISNLIVKVVTSPFSIIGSMFGGGEELSFVNFKYGSTAIDSANYKKIDTLAEILRDKPSVKLEIQGFYDKVKDYEALRMKKFYDMLKAEKLKKMLASGSNTKNLKNVDLSQQDVKQLINAVYAKAKFPKPMDDKGKEKKINFKEKKKLLITNIHINKDDLRFLAMKRSEDIKAYLVSKGKINQKRIFLLEPKANPDSKKENTSQVEFSLK